jgi:hypothetical protein
MNSFLKGPNGDMHAGQPKFRERLLLFGCGLKKSEPKNDSQVADAFSRRASF